MLPGSSCERLMILTIAEIVPSMLILLIVKYFKKVSDYYSI